MTSLSRILTSRSRRISIQLAALGLATLGVTTLVLAEAETAIIVAAIALSLVALGAVKLAIISLVATTRTESRVLSMVKIRQTDLTEELRAAAASNGRKVGDIIQVNAELRTTIGELTSQVEHLSRLIDPSVTLIQLKDQELLALKEQLARYTDLGSPESSTHRGTAG